MERVKITVFLCSSFCNNNESIQIKNQTLQINNFECYWNNIILLIKHFQLLNVQLLETKIINFNQFIFASFVLACCSNWKQYDRV